MDKNIYLFNPDSDMALASFSPYYKPPAEIACMAADLAVLPAWYAPSGSCVKVGDLECMDRWKQECAGILPPMEWCTEWDDGPYRPWGWNPALVYALKRQGVADVFLPDADRLQGIRRLSGRRTGGMVLEELRRIRGTCGKSVVCCSVGEVRKLLAEQGNAVLKSPWSGSGRGIVRLDSPASWSPSVEGWVLRTLRVQGEIMVEPIYNKVCDFAMEFYSDGRGLVSFAGYSLFETGAKGNYQANLLLPDARIALQLARYLPSALLHKVREALLAGLPLRLGTDYTGYLGVDMMVCREDGEYLLHPCVEINLRMNMGVVSRGLADRFLHPSAHGRYTVAHYTDAGNALAAHARMTSRYPLQTADGRILSGYLSLTPVLDDTRYQAYMLVEKQQDVPAHTLRAFPETS